MPWCYMQGKKKYSHKHRSPPSFELSLEEIQQRQKWRMNCLPLHPESRNCAFSPGMACEQCQHSKHSVKKLENRFLSPHSPNSYRNKIVRKGNQWKLNHSQADTHYWHKLIIIAQIWCVWIIKICWSPGQATFLLWIWAEPYHQTQGWLMYESTRILLIICRNALQIHRLKHFQIIWRCMLWGTSMWQKLLPDVLKEQL